METTQVSINRWMHKEDVAYIHNGVLFSFKKKKRNLAICYNMDGLRGIMLNEISQVNKDKYRVILPICGIKIKI